MANFLTRLVTRTLGTASVMQPLIAPLFASGPLKARDFSLDALTGESLTGTGREVFASDTAIAPTPQLKESDMPLSGFSGEQPEGMPIVQPALTTPLSRANTQGSANEVLPTPFLQERTATLAESYATLVLPATQGSQTPNSPQPMETKNLLNQPHPSTAPVSQLGMNTPPLQKVLDSSVISKAMALPTTVEQSPANPSPSGFSKESPSNRMPLVPLFPQPLRQINSQGKTVDFNEPASSFSKHSDLSSAGLEGTSPATQGSQTPNSPQQVEAKNRYEGEPLVSQLQPLEVQSSGEPSRPNPPANSVQFNLNQPHLSPESLMAPSPQKREAARISQPFQTAPPTPLRQHRLSQHFFRQSSPSIQPALNSGDAPLQGIMSQENGIMGLGVPEGKWQQGRSRLSETEFPVNPQSSSTEPFGQSAPASPAVPPTIQVTIGRIEVRKANLPAAPKSRAQSAQGVPGLSLENYLKQRNEGKL